VTQPEDHTTLQFTDYTQLTRDLGSEPINLGRHAGGRPAILDPFRVVTEPLENKQSATRGPK